jgi:hypothetical protein
MTLCAVVPSAVTLLGHFFSQPALLPQIYYVIDQCANAVQSCIGSVVIYRLELGQERRLRE